ncbi:MAG: RNA polymerase sigma factor [Candidatus Portnoybacteria bacterium]|nr:RNA polymerase sigma factor [Candidatus Portnoybacteria bacterium]
MLINEKQFLDFYDKYIAKIYRYIYFRVGSEEVAKDLSSEVFLRVWKYLQSGEIIGNLSAMAYKIARNLISDHFRKTSDKLPLSLETLPITLASSDNTSENTSDNFELDRIKACLKDLRAEYQEMVIWRYIEDLDIEEIAQITGKSQNAVRTTISRAMAALKRAVELKQNQGIPTVTK